MRSDKQGSAFQLNVPYADRAHFAQFPGTLAREALLSGQRPPALAEPFVYCDMGCGSGGTVLTLAAANPHAQFYGVDLSAGHIEHANKARESAGIENATFYCGSFADAQAENVPPCDFISAHGILSWIPTEAEEELFTAVQSLLKSGGLFQASANMIPGWAQMTPVRRMMLDVIRNTEGDSQTRLLRAIEVASAFCRSDQPFSQRNPDAVRIVDAWKESEASYVAHEMLGGEWRLFAVGDVLDMALGYGLECCGPVRHTTTGAQAFRNAFCQEVDDPFALESLMSHCGGESFRSMTFIKPGAEGFTRESLVISGEDVIGFPSLERWSEQPEAAIADSVRALDDHPLSIAAAMERMVAAGEEPMEEVHNMTTMLGRSLATRKAIPFVSLARDFEMEADAPIRACHRLTDDVLSDPRTYRFGGHVPSPVMGGGVHLSPQIAALLKVRLDNAQETLPRAQSLIAEMSLKAPPWAVDDPAREVPDPVEVFETFDKNWLLYLGRMGVIQTADE